MAIDTNMHNTVAYLSPLKDNSLLISLFLLASGKDIVLQPRNRPIKYAELYGLVFAPRLKKGYHQIWEANLQPKNAQSWPQVFLGPDS
jgi:hypothetical protein